MSENVIEFARTAKILTARFDNRADAENVGAQIEALGYDPRELSYVNDAKLCSFTFDGIGNHASKAAAEGIVGGGVLGGAMGAGAAITSLGSLVLLGPIGFLTGAVIGGISGILLGLGLDSDQAIACENAINRGSLVMTIRAHADDSGAVRAVLGEHILDGATP